MTAWRYEISLLVLKNISLVRANIFQHSKRNFVSPRGHVISSIFDRFSEGKRGLKYGSRLSVDTDIFWNRPMYPKPAKPELD